MPEQKITPTDFENQVQELHTAGKLPTLQQVLEAVVDAREKYGDKIKQAQKIKSPADTLSAKPE